MNRVNRKISLARIAVACALGSIVVSLAWATPGVGISTTIVAGPIQLGAVDVRTESDLNEIEFKTKGLSDIYVVYNTVVPGGHTGWHSHPGPSIVSVRSGTATNYHSDDPNTPNVHPAGTSFVDEGGDHAHIVRNEGSTNLELVAFQILPRGATRRIDRPAP